MKFELETLPRNSSFEEIKKEIIRVAKLISKKNITKKEFDSLSKISSSTLIRRFGNWKNILIKCGLSDRYSGKIISDKMKQQTKHLTDDEIIKEVQRVAKTLNKNSMTTADLNDNSKIISDSTVRNRFGSWYNGLKMANLTELIKNRQYSGLDYYDNLLKVWTHYGRQPKYREMDMPPSSISSGAYEGKWGKWSSALIAFVKYTNRDIIADNEPETPIQISSSKDKINIIKTSADRRTIPLGLRYKVLLRDRFRCVKCGRNPSTDLNCVLNVDHIIPFSKGGKTIMENLQATCKECNLGKGNRFNG